jgi:hypothetical protein
MTRKRKYLIKKIADEGEDVAVDAKKFDGLLGKLLSAPPLPLEKLREEPGRLAARRPRKAAKRQS